MKPTGNRLVVLEIDMRAEGDLAGRQDRLDAVDRRRSRPAGPASSVERTSTPLFPAFSAVIHSSTRLWRLYERPMSSFALMPRESTPRSRLPHADRCYEQRLGRQCQGFEGWAMNQMRPAAYMTAYRRISQNAQDAHCGYRRLRDGRSLRGGAGVGRLRRKGAAEGTASAEPSTWRGPRGRTSRHT